MNDRLTRQGVRNLNSVGHNGHRNSGSRCKHWFGAPVIVIGHRWAAYPIDGSAYEEPVWGQKCVWCNEVRES